MALLQSRSTSLSPGLRSLATLLFKRLTRGILPKFSRQVVLCDKNESNLIVLLNRQPLTSQFIDTSKNILFLPVWSTVVVWKENGEPWTHGLIIAHGMDDSNGRSYRVRETKTGHTTIRMKRHIKPTKIFVEDYHWNEMTKANQTLAVDRQNELVNHFMQLDKNDHHNKTKIEDKEV